MTVIFVRSIIFFLVLVLSMRFMGKRQIGEIELTEFVGAVMLSELAALPVTDTDIPLTHGIAAVGVPACLEVIIAYVCRRVPTVRRLVDGKPLVLVAKGRVLEDNLTKSRISTDELFAAIRSNGFKGIEDIGYVILEPTGALSVIPAENGISHVLILDGKVQTGALKISGKDMDWIKARLKEEKLKQEELLYFAVDDAGDISYEKKSGN